MKSKTHKILFFILSGICLFSLGYLLRVGQEMKREEEGVINAFQLVNESIEVNTDEFHDKRNTLVNEIQSLPGQDKATTELKNNVSQISEKGDSLVNYIETVKQRIISKGDGEPYDPNNAKSVHNIKNKDDLNAAAELMLDKNRAQEILVLESRVDEFREYLLSFLNEDTPIHNNISLSLATNAVGDSISTQTWGERLFAHMPLVGSIALLTKLQTDVRNAEIDIIEKIYTYYEINEELATQQ